MDQNRFDRWLTAVAPSEDRKYEIKTQVDWNLVLQVLMQIFELLVQFGCFGARRYSAKVRVALKGPKGDQVPALQMIRDQMVAENQNKETHMRSLFLLVAVLSTIFCNVDSRAESHAVYSAKYQRHFFLGLKKHPKTRAPMKSYRAAEVKVPNTFDMRSKWPLPPGMPYDQADCGSCVVNSVTGNVTYALSIRGLLPNPYSPLSRGQVMECNPTAGQCDGDWAENVGKYISQRGHLLSELSYKYTPRTGSCKNLSGTEYGPIPTGRVIDNSEESIAKALVQGIPVSITVGAGGAWMNYEPSDYPDGVFTACSNIGTNHEVLIIGIKARGAAVGADGFINFAAAKPGDIAFIVLNSWGQWGDKGVITTVVYNSRGARCNNVADEAYAFDFPPVIEAVPSCKVQGPGSVTKGQTAVATLTSQNAVSATVDGKTVPVNGTFPVATDTSGFQHVLVNLTGQAGSTGSCETDYTVLPAPDPTPTGGFQWWYLLVLAGIAALAYFVGKAKKPNELTRR